MRGRSRKAILEGVAKLRRRWFAVHFLRSSLRAFFYLLLVAALALLVVPGLGSITALCAAAAGALLFGLAHAVWRLPDRVALAKSFDDEAGLVDRVSSSVELMGEGHAMVEALLEEGAEAARTVQPERVYPHQLPREGWLLPLPALLVAAVLLLPGLLSAEPEPDPAVEELLHANVHELEEILAREKAKELTPRRKELIAELEKLKTSLDREKLDKKDAMADIAELLEKLQKERETQKKEREELKKLLESLRQGDKTEQLAEQMKQGDYEDALNKLQELIDDLKKKLEELKKDGADKEELERLENELKKLQELRAKLLKLLQIDIDLAMMGEMIEFLGDFEGELADIEDLDLEFVKHDCDCDKPGL